MMASSSSLNAQQLQLSLRQDMLAHLVASCMPGQRFKMEQYIEFLEGLPAMNRKPVTATGLNLMMYLT
jgi:hypothetical protein